MLDKELVSIIMPAFNSSKYISNSITSIQEQSYTHWELIIVDDASTDNTVEVINSFKDSRIRLLRNTHNEGAALSRNKALREANGMWITFLDSDDIWMNKKLETQLNYMRLNNCSFTYTDYIIEQNGKRLPYKFTAPNFINKRRIFNYCYFSTITVMYDQSIVGLIQIPDLKKNNDYAMWLIAIEKTNFYRIPIVLSCYVKHTNSISSGSKLKLIKWHYILFRKGFNKNKVVSMYLTTKNLIFGILKKIFYKKNIKEADKLK